MMKIARPYQRAAMLLFRTLNTPVALSSYLLTRHNEWDQLATRSVDPKDYLDTTSGVEKYRRDVQAVDFLRKSGDLPTTIDRREAAIKSFDSAERKCLETNYFLDMLALRSEPSMTDFERATLRILRRARKICARILGPVPPSLDGGFGPGTSFELKGSAFSTLADKLWTTPHVTREAEAVWRHTTDSTFWSRQRLALGLPYLSHVRGNRFTTVPKDGKTDRGICIEPLGNLYCQLGAGRYLKERLAGVGLYVQRNTAPSDPVQLLRYRGRPNGQHLHRSLAEIASRDGCLATIDLSSASDTVAYNLVRELLPPDWFRLLDSLRSPYTLMPNGRWVRLNKFSSMGNGYTFELETLIFASLAAAVSGLRVGGEIFVYGDDIIVPTDAAPSVVACLQTFGFIPNKSKTFLTGLFRESCGGDYFAGVAVRPYQSKRCPSSPPEWMAMHNRLLERGFLSRTLSKYLVEQVPTKLRLFGPRWAGDSTFHSDPSLWRPWLEDGITWIRGVTATPVRLKLDRWSEGFSYVLATLGVSSSGLTPRGEVSGYRTVRISIS